MPTSAAQDTRRSLRWRVGRLLHLARVRGARRTLRAGVQACVFAFRRWYIFYRPIGPGRSVPTGPPLSNLTLGPGQLWTVDAHTLPDYRRHHVASALRAYRNRVLAERGYRESVASVQADNLPCVCSASAGSGWSPSRWPSWSDVSPRRLLLHDPPTEAPST